MEAPSGPVARTRGCFSRVPSTVLVQDADCGTPSLKYLSLATAQEVSKKNRPQISAVDEHGEDDGLVHRDYVPKMTYTQFGVCRASTGYFPCCAPEGAAGSKGDFTPFGVGIGAWPRLQ